VEQQAVDVLGAELATVPVERVLRLGRPVAVIPWHLRLDEDLLARQALDRLAHHLVRLVVVGGIDVRDAAIERLMDQPAEAVHAEIALDLSVVAAGAEAEARDRDTAPAERHLIARHAPHSRVPGCADGQRGADRGERRAKKLPPIESLHPGASLAPSSSRRRQPQVKVNGLAVYRLPTPGR
jgi:hypothetical protein